MKLRDRMVVCGALLCATVTAAQADTAKLPNPSLCSVPCGICLVGCAGGAADPAGTFSVVVRDFPNHPIAYAVVVVDFSQCCGTFAWRTRSSIPACISTRRPAR